MVSVQWSGHLYFTALEIVVQRSSTEASNRRFDLRLAVRYA